ncbi:MAG: hypothetical protein MK136_17855 [Pirellulaceae bacterium]|nr:hypothetical protein [Pirellulaceae bacterium]
MTPEEFDTLLRTELREFDGTVERIPPKKESEGTQKVQFFMVKNPRPSQQTAPSESTSTGKE